MIETLAYIGDVLSFEQDRVAAEGFVATAYDEERDLLRVDLRADARPVVCVVVDDRRACGSPRPTATLPRMRKVAFALVGRKLAPP